MTDNAFWAPPAVPRPAGRRGRLLAAAVVAVVLVVGAVVLDLVRTSRSGAADVALDRPLVEGEVQGVLVVPHGYERVQGDPVDPVNLCSAKVPSPKAPRAPTVVLVANREGTFGGWQSLQELQVFATPAEARARARALTAGAPCSHEENGRRFSISRRAAPGSFAGGTGHARSALLIDTLAVGNVLVLDVDAHAGLDGPDFTGHDARRHAIVSALVRLASTPPEGR